jgi:hypothetical protein
MEKYRWVGGWRDGWKEGGRSKTRWWKALVLELEGTHSNLCNFIEPLSWGLNFSICEMGKVPALQDCKEWLNDMNYESSTYVSNCINGKVRLLHSPLSCSPPGWRQGPEVRPTLVNPSSFGPDLYLLVRPVSLEPLFPFLLSNILILHLGFGKYT